MKQFLNWFWRDKVSLILLVVFIAMGIGYFSAEKNYTPALFMAALYIIASVIEKGKLMDFLIENSKTIKVREELQLPLSIYSKKEWTTFEMIVQIIIMLGTVITLVLAVFSLVGHPLL